jgi:hypothetical protein
LDFDGTDFVQIATPSEIRPTTPQLTIEAWIKPGDLTGTHDIVTEAWCRDFALYTVETNAYTRVWTSAGSLILNSNFSLSLNKWHHLAMTHDGSVLRIYVNGTLKNSGNRPGSVGNIEAYTKIGASTVGCGSTGNYFMGLIDEVRIYNYSLMAGEIQKHYAEGFKTHQNTLW